MTEEVLTEEERHGVKMIVYLQKMVGIDEPEDRALSNWRSMRPHSRTMTRITYDAIRGSASDD